MRLFGLDEGVVFPHEQTFSGPKEDRYRLFSATAMGLSPVFLLYDLPGDEVTNAWKAGPGAQAPSATVADEAGTVTRLWPTTDPELLATISRNLAASRFVIADGHHRYETALRYKMNRLPETTEPNRVRLRPGLLQQHVGPGTGHIRHASPALRRRCTSG